MTPPSLESLSPVRRRIVRAWCMYDWANSGFATSGAVALFPFYFVFLFKDALGEEAVFLGLTFTGSSTWAFGVAASTALVALTSPVLGVIADRVAIKKALLCVYTITGSLFTVLAFFSVYAAQPWAWVFGMFMLANVGFAGSLIFYNAFLPHIAPRELFDEVSSRGFAYGYVGGGLLLAIHLGLVFLTRDTDAADLVTRLSIASVGVWWFGWAIWTLKVVPEPPIPRPIRGLTPAKALSMGFRELGRTFREVRRFRVVLFYLAAYLLFNDGIQSVLAISGAFAADTLRIPLLYIMLTILIIQFIAAPSAMAFSRLARRITTKGALFVSLIGWCLIVTFGLAVVPLVPNEHAEFDYRLAYENDRAAYVVESAPEPEASHTGTLWQAEAGAIVEGDVLATARVETLLERVRQSGNSAYSASVRGGGLDGERAVGALHPSALEDGPLDWWPAAVRGVVWEPLGLYVGVQWLFVGLFVGLVMGGSQALARSLFAQIAPETRSSEFFSFFGFMSRASSVIGPILYIAFTAAFDARVAIASIIAIILSGAVVLRWVDVAAGAQVAAAEDARLRAAPDGSRDSSCE